MAKTWKEKYNKKYGYPKDKSHSLEDIAKKTGISLKGIKQIFEKGKGAFKTNPQSVRPSVKSPEQWGYGRVYSAVMGGKSAKIDKKELKMEKGGFVQKFYYGGEIQNSVLNILKEEPVVEETCFVGVNPYNVKGQDVLDLSEEEREAIRIENQKIRERKIKEAEDRRKGKPRPPKNPFGESQVCYKNMTWFLTAEYPEVAEALYKTAPNIWLYYKYLQRISIGFEDMLRVRSEIQNYFNRPHIETYRYDVCVPKGVRGAYQLCSEVSPESIKRGLYEVRFKKGVEEEYSNSFPIPVQLVDVEDTYKRILDIEKRKGGYNQELKFWKQQYVKGGCFATIGKGKTPKIVRMGVEMKTGEFAIDKDTRVVGTDIADVLKINNIFYNNFVGMSDNKNFSWASMWKHKKTGLFFPEYRNKSYNLVVLLHELAHCMHYQRQIVRISKIYTPEQLYEYDPLGSHDWEFVHCLTEIFNACAKGKIDIVSKLDKRALRVQYLLDTKFGDDYLRLMERTKETWEESKPLREADSGFRFGLQVGLDKEFLKYIEEEGSSEWELLKAKKGTELSLYEALLLDVFRKEYMVDEYVYQLRKDPVGAGRTFKKLEELQKELNRLISNHWDNYTKNNKYGDRRNPEWLENEKALIKKYNPDNFDLYGNWKGMVLDEVLNNHL